ncbi:hypothetical protein [Methyloterricola oryzae]|uniref:hypothetical protein n=1 Tax=Methyloterricola oryzae TaxID=1495050 RepID=UPI0005EB0F43|nr:hypothetical protein [Methyloterricola oryzae]
MIDANKRSETTREALPLLDVLSEVLEQMHSGALPAYDDPRPSYLIDKLRTRYASDEEVQRLCAWTENQMGALGEMVSEVIGFLREEVSTGAG